MSEITVRRFDMFEDYEDVKSWWLGHKWTPVEPEVLPKIGFISQSEKEKLCAVWIYQSDAVITWLEWLVSNPKADKEDRKQAIDPVIKRALWTAKDLGYTKVYTSVKHPLLNDRYKKLGFQETDSGVTQLIRNLELEI